MKEKILRKLFGVAKIGERLSTPCGIKHTYVPRDYFRYYPDNDIKKITSNIILID